MNEDNMPAHDELTHEIERLRICEARSEAITFGDEKEPTKISIEWKKRRYRDLKQVQLLSLNGEDFSQLMGIGQLNYYDDILDRKI